MLKFSFALLVSTSIFFSVFLLLGHYTDFGFLFRLFLGIVFAVWTGSKIS